MERTAQAQTRFPWTKDIKTLSREQEHALAIRYRDAGDEEAKNELVTSHLPLVIGEAFRHKDYPVDVEELIQEGTIGLIRAVEKFDPYKGFRLGTYAIWWIKAYIKNYILSIWSLVRIGTTVPERKLFFKMGAIGEQPDEESRQEHLAQYALEMSVKVSDIVELTQRVRNRDVSLAPGSDATGTDLYETLADESAGQEELLMEFDDKKDLEERVEIAFKDLDLREKYIIRKRFMSDSPTTLQSLGKQYGVSRERIRQIEQKAIKMLEGQRCLLLT
jgi:RNA polymerase sigma-32 factor